VSTWISRLVVALLALPLAAVAVPALAAAPTVAAPIRIMPLGDSITFGMGSTTGSGYRAELWRRLVEQSGYGVDLVGSARTGTLPDIDHEGHSGWTIAQLSDSVDGWLAAATPDVVLLHIGTNDVASDLMDWLHPNDGGYVKMGAAWASALTPVLTRPGMLAGTGGTCLDTG
jgi:lysophospholipase L1-like esterase